MDTNGHALWAHLKARNGAGSDVCRHGDTHIRFGDQYYVCFGTSKHGLPALDPAAGSPRVPSGCPTDFECVSGRGLRPIVVRNLVAVKQSVDAGAQLEHLARSGVRVANSAPGASAYPRRRSTIVDVPRETPMQCAVAKSGVPAQTEPKIGDSQRWQQGNLELERGGRSQSAPSENLHDQMFHVKHQGHHARRQESPSQESAPGGWAF